MIENKLTRHELSRVFRPFLRLEPIPTILPSLQDVLGFSIQDCSDVVCQNKFLVTFEGYRIDIRDLRQTADDAASIIIQFKAKKKWWHGILSDQNSAVVRAIQDICRAEIANLDFTRFEPTVPGNLLKGDDEPQSLVFLHDSRAFNEDWEAGYDISPLLIGPDCHHGNCFVEVQFNAAAYRRSGNTTTLKDDWLASAFSVSKGIEQDARELFGLAAPAAG